MKSFGIIATKPFGVIIGCLFITSFILQTNKKIKRGTGLFIKKRPDKKCFECYGFGIIRCNLCAGEGFVSYERKYQRSDLCPKCLQKRYDICPYCRGTGKRVLYGTEKNSNVG